MPLKLDASVLDRSSAVPLTTQLADHLRQAIATRAVVPGEKLPGEIKIAEAVGLSRDMVRNALDALAEEGLIVRRNGVPTRVAIPPSVRVVNLLGGSTPIGEDPEASFATDHGATAADYRLTNVKVSREKATGQDAEYLKVRKGTPILRRWLVENLGTGTDGKPTPVQLQRQAMRWALVKGTPIAAGEVLTDGGGILTELRAVGINPTHYWETFAPRMPNTIERALLNLPAGPVYDWLKALLIADDPAAANVTAANSTPVQISRIIVPCSRMHLHAEGRLILPG